MPLAAARARHRLNPLALVLGLVAAGATIAAVAVVGPERTSAGAGERVVTVGRGVVQSTVSGSGNLAPARQTALSFATAGTVSRVDVHAGQHVAAGQALARLDPADAELTLAQARADLQSAQQALDQAEAGTTSTPSSPATATPSASARAAATPTGPTSSGPTATTPGSRAGTTPAATAPTTTTTTTVDAAAVASARVKVTSAQLAVTRAEQGVADTVLRAPFSGTVAVVDGAVGDAVSGSSSSSSSPSSDRSAASAAGANGSGSGSGFVTLARLDRLHLKVSLSEADIGDVHVGQAATVTVDAASGEQVAGRVIAVDVLSSSSSSSTTGGSSAVSYPVTIALTQTTRGLRAGMSASADIVTGEARGVVVPNAALRGSSVTVVAGGRRTTRQVTAGLAGDRSTQVLDGLRAGERVVVTSASAVAGANAGTTGATTGAAGQRRGLGGGLGGGGLARGAGGFTGGPPAGGFAGGGPP